jgi:hypothetical protein
MGDADNIILGNSVTNVIHGQGGDDTLYGGAGDDALYGGAGDDVLVSGTGSNDLQGGAGDDRYEIGGHGQVGLREGDVDTIFDTDGANIVDFDGVARGDLSFNMGGDDLVIAVENGGEVHVRDFDDGSNGATFEVQADDYSWDHAALLTAVQEMQARGASAEPESAEMKADVLDGYVGASAGATTAAAEDPLAPFMTGAEAAGVESVDAGPGGLAEAAGTFVDPGDTAGSTEAAAAGLASKPAGEEEPVYG